MVTAALSCCTFLSGNILARVSCFVAKDGVIGFGAGVVLRAELTNKY